MLPCHQLVAGRLFGHPFGNKSGLISVGVALILGMNFTGAEAQGQRSRQPVDKQTAKLALCLPPDVRLGEVASYRGPGKVTVAEKLKELNARCRRGRMTGPGNKEIRFFRMVCWGYPPPDYQEIQAEQRRGLAQLKAKYTVIVISCDPRIP